MDQQGQREGNEREAGCAWVSVCLSLGAVRCVCLSVLLRAERNVLAGAPCVAGSVLFLGLLLAFPLPRGSLPPSRDLVPHPEASGDTEVDLLSRRQRR